MKAALAAVLLFCICTATSQAADGHAIAQKSLEAMDKINLMWMGTPACRIDFDIKESVIVNGVEQNDRTKNSKSFFLKKDIFTYKLKIDQDQEIVQLDFKTYVADQSKQAVELPDSLAQFMEKLTKYFDAYNVKNSYEDTSFSVCTQLPDSKVEGRDCYVLEYANPGNGDTTVFFIDKGTYLTKQVLQKMTIENSSGTITYLYDYTLGEHLGVFKKVLIENFEQGGKHVTTFTTKKFEIIDDLNENDFKYNVIKTEE